MLRLTTAIGKNGREFDCELSISEMATHPESPRIFTLVIRDITERRRAERAEAESREMAARLKELERDLQLLGEYPTYHAATSVTSRIYGRKPLQEIAPILFDQLVNQYRQVMDLAIEKKVLKVEHNIPDQLQDMAEEMGRLSSGPRDVVEVHRKALTAGCAKKVPQKVQAYTEEGRFLVLELMGNLVSFYRKYYAEPCTRHFEPNKSAGNKEIEKGGVS